MTIKTKLPNLLSMLRVILSAVTFFAIKNKYKITSLMLVTIAGITDFLDGYYARKFNVMSKCGEIIDPISDKIFTNVVLWSIYSYISDNYFIFSVALLLSVRDFCLVVSCCIIAAKHYSIDRSPNYLSKINTTIIFIVIFCGIFLGVNNALFKALCVLASTTTVVTCITYALRLLA